MCIACTLTHVQRHHMYSSLDKPVHSSAPGTDSSLRICTSCKAKATVCKHQGDKYKFVYTNTVYSVTGLVMLIGKAAAAAAGSVNHVITALRCANAPPVWGQQQQQQHWQHQMKCAIIKCRSNFGVPQQMKLHLLRESTEGTRLVLELSCMSRTSSSIPMK